MRLHQYAERLCGTDTIVPDMLHGHHATGALGAMQCLFWIGPTVSRSRGGALF